MEFQIKNLQEFPALDQGDGIPFTASVYVDGKRAFTVADRGFGGGFEYEIINQNLFEQAEEYVNSLENVTYDFGSIPMSMDLFLSDLLNETANQNNFQKISKTKWIIYTDDCEKNQYKSIPKIFSQDEVIEYLETHYKNSNSIIIDTYEKYKEFLLKE